MREFRRQVRLALEQHHMLPGDPNRVFRLSEDTDPTQPNRPVEEAAPAHDPTTLKPRESNPFTGES
jgi:hypothetical protein